MTDRTVTVDDVMSDLKTVPEGTAVPDAAAMMLEEGVGSLIITADERSTGIITETDIVELVASNSPTDTITVAEIMSSPLITVESGASIEIAADRMKSERIKKLPVERADEIVGMVTTTDISHYFPQYHPKSESWIH